MANDQNDCSFCRTIECLRIQFQIHVSTWIYEEGEKYTKVCKLRIFTTHLTLRIQVCKGVSKEGSREHMTPYTLFLIKKRPFQKINTWHATGSCKVLV